MTITNKIISKSIEYFQQPDVGKDLINSMVVSSNEYGYISLETKYWVLDEDNIDEFLDLIRRSLYEVRA